MGKHLAYFEQRISNCQRSQYLSVCAHISHCMVFTLSTAVNTERFLKLVLSKIAVNKGCNFPSERNGGRATFEAVPKVFSRATHKCVPFLATPM